MSSQEYIIWLDKLGMGDVDRVGGKNASLGELLTHLQILKVNVPMGFATTSAAYWDFLQQENLKDRISSALKGLDINNISDLSSVGKRIRQWVINTPLPALLLDQLKTAYDSLTQRYPLNLQESMTVAVRSSATAEDLPDASFAGQQETFLNISGFDHLVDAVGKVYASLFTDRAIAYRCHQGFAHEQVALSVGVQSMVRSDCGASGVMFTIDTESGFEDVIFITSSYGLGEAVVQGVVNPDEFYVHKPTLQAGRPAIVRRNIGSKQQKMIYTQDRSVGHTIKLVPVAEGEQQQFSLNDVDVEILARYALSIEAHYGRPMDIEWAKDGQTGEIFILQARPETVKSREDGRVMQRYQCDSAASAEVKTTGRAIGQKIGAGKARVVSGLGEMDRVQAGDVLVTDMTDPDWEPIMKRASAIVTNRGGRTCHAAIIAREMGIPAVVGCNDATRSITEGEEITVSCAQGDTGYIYAGKLDFNIQSIKLDAMPELPFAIMMNVANPDRAFDFCQIPNSGIGLARLEFIINRMIGIHPKALLEFDSLPEDLRHEIRRKTCAYKSPVDYYVDRLAEGIATLAAAFSPKRIIVRLSDFKSNEYANLIGGSRYEPDEENPMLGFRGASRYISASFRDCFELECRALRKVRDTMGFTHLEVMVPFVRTPQEGKQVVRLLAENGLKRGENGLKIIMMCELPSNALLADTFLEDFDGFSIGSNDLTQLTLGLDRDSALVADQFDERDEAVKVLLHQAIVACKKHNKYIGICGQGPSDHPDFAHWLMAEGIDSISLNPDSVLETWLYLAEQREKSY